MAASAEEYRREVFATAVTLSSRIAGLSDKLGVRMEPDRWEQIERLYHAALGCGPDAREAFLDEACAGDKDLRREVAGLLASDNPSDSFIQITIHEIGETAMENGSLRYIVTEYVEGETLRQRMARAPQQRIEIEAKLGETAFVAPPSGGRSGRHVIPPGGGTPNTARKRLAIIAAVALFIVAIAGWFYFNRKPALTEKRHDPAGRLREQDGRRILRRDAQAGIGDPVATISFSEPLSRSADEA